MTAYFRITIEDLGTGETSSAEVAEGDYVLIPFDPCYLANVGRHANGTVQLTLKNHFPAGKSRNAQEGQAVLDVVDGVTTDGRIRP